MAGTTRANAPSELDIEAARWFFQNTVDIFVLIRGGSISRINPAWTELSGWSVEETIGRPILLENPSTYVIFPESTMSETDFIRALVRRTGCGLLLDVNNVFVSATNHGYSALGYLADYPLENVGEIHLAGHAKQTDDEGELLLIDSHDGPVADAVWKLFDMVIDRCGAVPTLIEWDSDIPDWPILKAEATAAQVILDRHADRPISGNAHANH